MGLDHVYFVHPSTDVSVDMSTNTRLMYQSTYRPILERHSTDISTDISIELSTECRSIYRLTIGRYLVQYSDRHSADTEWSVGTVPIQWEAQWPNGQCVLSCSERSGFEP